MAGIRLDSNISCRETRSHHLKESHTCQLFWQPEHIVAGSILNFLNTYTLCLQCQSETIRKCLFFSFLTTGIFSYNGMKSLCWLWTGCTEPEWHHIVLTTNWLIGTAWISRGHIVWITEQHCLPRRPLPTGNYVKQHTPTRFELENRKRPSKGGENINTDAVACSQPACANSPGTLAAFLLHGIYFLCMTTSRTRLSLFSSFLFKRKLGFKNKLTFSMKVGTGAAPRCACSAA